MTVTLPTTEEIARLLWEQSGQGGFIFETRERRFEVAQAIVDLLRSRLAPGQAPREEG